MKQFYLNAIKYKESNKDSIIIEKRLKIMNLISVQQIPHWKNKSKDFLDSLEGSELIALIYSLCQSLLSEKPSLEEQCAEWLGINFLSLEKSLFTLSKVTKKDLYNLQETISMRSSKNKNLKDSSLNLFFAASTVPITPLTEIIKSLLARTPIICRIPENYSLEFYTTLFKKAPARLKDCFEFVNWPSSFEEETKAFINEADCIIVHGSDETVLSLKSLSANKQFLGFGHKASFTVCRPLAGLVDNVFEDIKAFQQNGCLSPQCIFCLNFGSDQIMEFGKALAEKLDNFHFVLSPAEAYKKQTFLEKGALKENCLILGNSVIISQENKNFSYSCGNGLVWLKPLNNLEELVPAVARLNERIGAIGHNLLTEDQMLLERMFATIRICEIGQMQYPKLDWMQEPTHI